MFLNCWEVGQSDCLALRYRVSVEGLIWVFMFVVRKVVGIMKGFQFSVVWEGGERLLVYIEGFGLQFFKEGIFLGCLVLKCWFFV